ncbi:hypothetical protein [Longimicrobium sp.]|jgi:hypothetical protein|uniref:hypothetical protein n=1 Tax=Longimicrobium sp. TaxID=2029185 RepID=UPI002F922FB7
MVDYDRSYRIDAAPAASAGSTARTRPAAVEGPPPSRAALQDMARRFDELAAKWREDTEFDSAPTTIYQHPAYLEIVSWGPPVLPLMFADLATHGSFWFGALRTLTGEDPVPREDRGRIARMREHWLSWGRARGYLDG